jgi:site-specific recombinase XerD
MRHVQQRDNRWCIVDLVGTNGRMRTIPIPAWVKNAIDAWTVEADVTKGHLFRPVIRGDHICGERISEKVVWQMLKTYVARAGLPDIAPHDLRRTTAKLCSCGR